mgnify:CR=1 FL=1
MAFQGNKHKVFISLYYDEGRDFKKALIDWNEAHDHSLFDDDSVGENEIDDQDKTDEQVRRIIRKEYIKQSSVLLLLCGPKTKTRKFVDWELQAAMTDDPEDPNNKKCGILVINLPGSSNGVRAHTSEEKALVSGPSTAWHANKSRADYERDYPDLPSRIIDCFANNGCPIAIVDWDSVWGHFQNLFTLIDFAYQRRDELVYDTSAPLMGRNSTGQH